MGFEFKKHVIDNSASERNDFSVRLTPFLIDWSNKTAVFLTTSFHFPSQLFFNNNSFTLSISLIPSFCSYSCQKKQDGIILNLFHLLICSYSFSNSFFRSRYHLKLFHQKQIDDSSACNIAKNRIHATNWVFEWMNEEMKNNHWNKVVVLTPCKSLFIPLYNVVSAICLIASILPLLRVCPSIWQLYSFPFLYNVR